MTWNDLWSIKNCAHTVSFFQIGSKVHKSKVFMWIAKKLFPSIWEGENLWHSISHAHLISPPAGELRAEDPKEGLRRLSLAATACSFSFFWRMYSVGSNLGRPGADRGLPLLRGRSSLLDGQPVTMQDNGKITQSSLRFTHRKSLLRHRVFRLMFFWVLVCHAQKFEILWANIWWTQCTPQHMWFTALRNLLWCWQCVDRWLHIARPLNLVWVAHEPDLSTCSTFYIHNEWTLFSQ